MDKETVTFNDILSVVNQVWISGVKFVLVSSTYLRKDDSTAVAEKLIFRHDSQDLTLFDIYTQSILVLPAPDHEVDTYRYQYTLSNSVVVLIMYTHE